MLVHHRSSCDTDRNLRRDPSAKRHRRREQHFLVFGRCNLQLTFNFQNGRLLVHINETNPSRSSQNFERKSCALDGFKNGLESASRKTAFAGVTPCSGFLFRESGVAFSPTFSPVPSRRRKPFQRWLVPMTMSSGVAFPTDMMYL